jgi:two-component system OmpR family sensor kinase
MSLRARLLLGTALVALVLVASAVVITRATRTHLVEQVDAQLRDAGPQLRPLPGPDQGPTPRLSNLYVAVVSPAGAVSVLHAPDLRGADAPLPVVDDRAVAALRQGRAVTVASEGGGPRYRLLGRAEGPRGRLAVVGLSLDDVDGAVRRLVGVEALAVLAVLGVLALVMWWVIRLGVRPVREMTDTAEAIAAGDLSRRVPEAPAGTEAGALSASLNGMLGRIEGAFEQRAASEARLRQFVSDASHELRTPVTTIRGYAELYRSGGLDEPVELTEAMRRTEQEAMRMGALVEDLLRLARLDEGRPTARRRVDLSALAADAVRDAGATAPERAITLDAPAPVVVEGDEDGLRQVVANLVGNALVHAPGAAIVVRVTVEGDRAVLDVADDGPGMSEPDAARAFERFYRADASRSRQRGGSGLGLSIVDAIARAHGGSARITSAPGQGTTVTVELPLSAG